MEKLGEVCGGGKEAAVGVGLIGDPGDGEAGAEYSEDVENFGGWVAVMDDYSDFRGFKVFAEFEECGFELGGGVDVFGDVEGVEAGIDRFVAEEGEGLAEFGSIAEGLEAGEVEAEGVCGGGGGKLGLEIEELAVKLLGLGSGTNGSISDHLEPIIQVEVP